MSTPTASPAATRKKKPMMALAVFLVCLPVIVYTAIIVWPGDWFRPR